MTMLAQRSRIGFFTPTYIASPEWAQRRYSHFHRFGRGCKACGGMDSVQLHHRTHEPFTHESDADPIALCQTCHMWVHQLHRTTSLSLDAATDQILKTIGRVEQDKPAGQQFEAQIRAAIARKRLALQTDGPRHPGPRRSVPNPKAMRATYKFQQNYVPLDQRPLSAE
jgi:phage terminase large subunit GpA-like protein